MKRFFVGVVAVGCLTGCSAAIPTTLPTYNPAPITSAPVPVPDPSRLVIPHIGVDAPLVALGVAADGTQAVPPVASPEIAGWFEPGPEPGEPGRAVLVGHVNGGGRWGVFARLHEMKPGDAVTVDNRTWTVYEVRRVPKDKFPAAEVYGQGTTSEIRLITCGGEFDHGAQSYRDNIVVFAK